jgi:signal transduction histidine kinase
MLLSYREPIAMVSDALSILIHDFGASGGSLFYASRPLLRVRQGELSEPLAAHMDQWEASVEQRIISGPWRIAEDAEYSLATRRVPGTDHTNVYALILDDHVVVGSICLAFPQQQMPTGQQRASLTNFLKAIGGAVCLVSEYAYTKERLSQLSLFYQMAQSMASTYDLSKLLNDAMQLATAVLDASVSALMLVDEESQELVFEYTAGLLESALRKQRTPLDEGIAGWVAAHGIPAIINDAQNDPRFDNRLDTQTGFLTQSVVCAPIKIRGKTIGVLEALNKRSGQGFDSEDLSLLITTANQAAIAMESVRLYQTLRDERDRVIQAQENVRRQVARNLHDGTVQFLSAISMGIDHLERLLKLNPGAAKAELATLRDLTRQATQQARLALFELRPLILETQGLVPALEAYVDQLEGSEEFGLHFERSGDLPKLDGAVASTAFAIVQEAVANVKKHASARDVWLRLSGKDGWLQVVIEDNGKGFDPEVVDREYDKRGSIGLLTMRERADLIDGHLVIESNKTPGRSGTKVTLRVPGAETEDRREA